MRQVSRLACTDFEVLMVEDLASRRHWNFAKVELGGHGSVMVRRDNHLEKKVAMPLLAKFQSGLITNLAPLNSILVDMSFVDRRTVRRR